MTRYLDLAKSGRIDLNDGHWDPDPPDVDDAEETMLAVAAGEIDEAALADWLRQRVVFD